METCNSCGKQYNPEEVKKEVIDKYYKEYSPEIMFLLAQHILRLTVRIGDIESKLKELQGWRKE